jgi:hypothetical protein
MELHEFISNSLMEIMAGITSAKEKYDSRLSGNGVICPTWGGPDDQRNRMQEVNFDVAVTVSQKTEGGGGGGIKVVALDISGKVNHATENSTVSRISFSVPVLPPTTNIETK